MQLNSAFIITIIIGVLYSSPLLAQHYPLKDTLNSRKVKVMRVYETALDFVDGPKKERDEYNKSIEGKEPQRKLWEVYFFNNWGQIDSLIRWPSGPNFKNYQNKYVYIYDDHKLVETKEYNHQSQIVKHSIITSTDTGLYFRTFEYRKLKYESFINLDSVVIKTLTYYPPRKEWAYSITYDPEFNLKTEHWRGNNGAYRIETFQWTDKSGSPESFTHTLDEISEETDWKRVQKQKTYPLDSAGNVVNKYLGRFDDPYIHYNYYERIPRLEHQGFNFDSQFRKKEFYTEERKAIMYTFSGIYRNMLYELVYDYYE